MDKQPVIFQSTHRCGTKGLESFFREYYPSVYCVHQPKYSRLINIITTLRLYGVISDAMFSWVAYITRINRIERINEKFYLETNGFNLLLAERIVNEFPHTKIIHIVRDPRSWVVSYMNWTKGRVKSKIAYSYIPFWNLNLSRLDIMTQQQWLKLEEYQKFIHWWKFKNDLIESLYSDKHNYSLFRFEDLYMNRESNELHRLLEFIGLEYSDEMLNFFNKKRNESKTLFKLDSFWNAEKLEYLKSTTNSQMKKYSYI